MHPGRIQPVVIGPFVRSKFVLQNSEVVKIQIMGQTKAKLFGKNYIFSVLRLGWRYGLSSENVFELEPPSE